MEKKDICTDEGCAGGRRQHSGPTTGRYRGHWSKAGRSSLTCGADLDQVRGLPGILRLVRWLVTSAEFWPQI